MKKIIFVLVLTMGMVGALSAQVDGKAIGLRFGYGAEISYQHPLSQTNRAEFDLGFSGYRLGLTGIYHWVWDLSSVTDGLKWYVGPGVTIGTTTYPNGYYYSGYYGNSNGVYLGVAGQIGAEYNFSFPLQLSLDYRPEIYLLKPSWLWYSGAYGGVCLAARYRF